MDELFEEIVEDFADDDEKINQFLKAMSDYYTLGWNSPFAVLPNSRHIGYLFEYLFPNDDYNAMAEKCFAMIKNNKIPTINEIRE